MVCKIVASKTLCKHRKVATAVQHKNKKCSIFQINNGHNTWAISCILMKTRTQERCQSRIWPVFDGPWPKLNAWCSMEKMGCGQTDFRHYIYLYQYSLCCATSIRQDRLDDLWPRPPKITLFAPIPTINVKNFTYLSTVSISFIYALTLCLFHPK